MGNRQRSGCGTGRRDDIQPTALRADHTGVVCMADDRVFECVRRGQQLHRQQGGNKQSQGEAL
ncbi:hypothetical protein [Spectribacter hydrogenoxidans]|uniref:Uncharacterized protein n=1 Tax=Spectribacter hydrogenoxidans TaxID=3075608 RepID=A0ABU3BY87_9GAMM|nr:hypothetical protein [Salinisphaera sp. W335]MDT0634248.1 hypothetical protein [Salinisphaera sp. W335]